MENCERPENVGKNAGWYGAGPISESVEQIVPNPLELAFPGYDGVVWYWRSFDMAAIKGLDDVQIHFEGADYYAEAWLNGEYLEEMKVPSCPLPSRPGRRSRQGRTI